MLDHQQRISNPNISAPEYVIDLSNVAITPVLSFVTRGLVVAVGKLRLKTSIATADELAWKHPSHAELSLLPVIMIANGRNLVATLRLLTNAMETSGSVPSVRSWWRKIACAARRH